MEDKFAKLGTGSGVVRSAPKVLPNMVADHFVDVRIPLRVFKRDLGIVNQDRVLYHLFAGRWPDRGDEVGITSTEG